MLKLGNPHSSNLGAGFECSQLQNLIIQQISPPAGEVNRVKIQSPIRSKGEDLFNYGVFTYDNGVPPFTRPSSYVYIMNRFKHKLR